MRGFNRLAASPAAAAAASKRTLPSPASSSATAAYSTFSGVGGGGRGRGRGSSPPPPPQTRVPGQPEPDADEEDPFSLLPSMGHGRGQPVHPSSPVLPSLSSWMSSLKPPSPSGRGRGLPSDPAPADSLPKKPFFFKRDGFPASPETAQFADPEETPTPLPHRVSPFLPSAGRGKSRVPEPAAPVREQNRHIRPRASTSAGEPSNKMGREEAVKRAMDVLARGGGRGGRGRGRAGRGFARGRGRGGRFNNRGENDEAEKYGLYLGDNADGERLEKRLGEEKMKILNEAFEEVSWRALPSPMEDAYLDALHTNNMIEYEPEYLVDFDNPDIDEKPPMSLEDALEKVKPFLIAYEGIQSQEEWEEAVKEVMEKLPHMKELMDMYCGPDRVTAKQQQQELERVASTLPGNIPSSVKRFTDRALLSLQSNPGWGFDKKCQFMDKLVWEVSQHYK